MTGILLYDRSLSGYPFGVMIEHGGLSPYNCELRGPFKNRLDAVDEIGRLRSNPNYTGLVINVVKIETPVAIRSPESKLTTYEEWPADVPYCD